MAVSFKQKLKILSEKFAVVLVTVTDFSFSEIHQLLPQTCNQEHSIYLRLKTMVFVQGSKYPFSHLKY